MKVSIVGPQEDKWTEPQKEKAKIEIEFILKTASRGKIVTNFSIFHKLGYHVFDEQFNYKNVPVEVNLQLSKIILVSGHCPKGGVDIWTEEIAKQLNVQTEIYEPEVLCWNDVVNETIPEYREIKGKVVLAPSIVKGYRSRNIQIAESCDVLYCFVPQTYVPTKEEHEQGIMTDYSQKVYCKHCNELGHPSNGGCWTMQYAKKLGKETHLVVIK